MCVCMHEVHGHLMHTAHCIYTHTRYIPLTVKIRYLKHENNNRNTNINIVFALSSEGTKTTNIS